MFFPHFQWRHLPAAAWCFSVFFATSSNRFWNFRPSWTGTARGHGRKTGGKGHCRLLFWKLLSSLLARPTWSRSWRSATVPPDDRSWRSASSEKMWYLKSVQGYWWIDWWHLDLLIDEWLIDWSIDWFIERLIDTWLNGWLNGSLIDCFMSDWMLCLQLFVIKSLIVLSLLLSFLRLVLRRICYFWSLSD